MKKLILYIMIVTSSYFTGSTFVGTRPLGMGGAFIAVADDGNTITWNPLPSTIAKRVYL